MANLSNIQQALSELKNSYLGELPERCQLIENLVLKLKTDPDYQSIYQALYREIHSMKGSAGTHGIAIITKICHEFEELLNLISGGCETINDSLIDDCLAYVDLIRDAVELEQNGSTDIEAISLKLEKIRSQSSPKIYCCLVVDSSKSRGELYKEALAELPINISVLDNGHNALQSLLTDEYDILITSKELPSLNGIALIQALRASGSINQDIYTVLLTIDSDDSDVPNCTIRKDSGLLDCLTNTINKRIASL
ncbi:MAG: response regulator [Gammaproteobacteria bacterium]|nr:response regulator [Gammaproteobacteria bacterium]